MSEVEYTYEDLKKIITRLRGKDGCPWDREQTHRSLMPYLLEESYELVDAIQNNDLKNMKEELGDVLLQVFLHAEIAKENQDFTLEEIINELANKLVYRHPHVFKEERDIETAEDVKFTWEELKKKEKSEKTPLEAMTRVAKALPALTRAEKVYKKAVKGKLIENQVKDSLTDVEQELEMLKKMLNNGNCKQIEEEIGNLLFSIVNLSTFFDINAEFALTKSVEKFINRFRYIENSTFVEGLPLE